MLALVSGFPSRPTFFSPASIAVITAASSSLFFLFFSFFPSAVEGVTSGAVVVTGLCEAGVLTTFLVDTAGVSSLLSESESESDSDDSAAAACSVTGAMVYTGSQREVTRAQDGCIPERFFDTRER